MPTDALDPAELVHRLDLARTLAREAAEIILRHYSPLGHRFDAKPDGSPVTIADLQTEEHLRRRLALACPRDGLLGEEFGDQPGTSGYRWIIDPIDGTRSFVHGVPLFGTLIGLEFAGHRVAGVTHFPALGEQYFASRGGGAFLALRDHAPSPVRVSRVSSLADATLVTTDPAWMLRSPPEGFFARLAQSVRVLRGWSDCYAFAMVAAGRADIAIDPPMKPWDVAALEPLLLEAGASVTGWDGTPPTDGSRGLVACAPALWPALAGFLR